MSNETEVTAAPAPNLVSSERPENTEVVEDVVLEQPDIQDVIAGQEDPRAEIYKRHNQKRDAEEKGLVATDTDEINDGNAQIGVESDKNTDIIDPVQEELVDVKVMGDVRSVPKSKIDAAGGVENYQIRIAAQEQMERNAHERAANERRTAALDERERQQAVALAAIPNPDSQQAKANPDRSTPTDGQNLEEMARKYQEAVYDDAEDAPSILAAMVNQAANSGSKFDENAFRKQVKEDILSDQRQAKIVKASHTLISAHPELNERDPKFDPRMYNAIDTETIVVEREHADWEPEQVVQEAYNRIAKWKGNPQPETMSDKQAQKRAMNRPQVGSQRYKAPPPPPRQTSSDYVAQQRKARGLD
jgi:hypothetical protein